MTAEVILACSTHTKPMEAAEQTSVVHELGKEQELRIEVSADSGATLKLLSGAAEVFGAEIGKQQVVSLKPGTKIAVFSWFGAQVELSGATESAYIAEDTPMRMQLNIHANLEEMRKKALQRKTIGPRVMVVGPTDSGKSSLCKLILNYAVRTSWEPLFVDLDVGQTMITMPGSVAAVKMNEPMDICSGIGLKIPLAFFGGTVSPGDNPALYKFHTERLAGLIEQRTNASEHQLASGVVINTMGWIDGQGYELLLHAIEAFRVSAVIVIGHDRLYSDLSRAYSNKKEKINIVKLPKSGGVVTRQTTFRRQTRDARIAEYFYGPAQELSPSSSSVSFEEWKSVVYRLGGGPRPPDSALPIGAKPVADPIRVVPIPITKDLTHSILAVTHAHSADDLLASNVAGFVYVTSVDMDAQRVHFLSPCPGPLPSSALIAGTIKWYE